MTIQLGLEPRPLTSPLDEPPAARRGAPLAATGAALAVYGGAIALGLTFGASVVERVAPAAITQLVDIALPEPPKPVEPPKPEPAPEDAPRQRATRVAPPAAPPAARAAQVLSAPDDVVDFGDAMVTGSGTTYTGGVTQSAGTATRAVRDLGARGSGASIAPQPPPIVDRSRPPELAGGVRWDCPFPPEAELEGVARAVVTLRVDVALDGRVVAAAVTRDPGYGFGREARRCALRKRWRPGLDRAGAPTTGTAVVNVRFDPP